VTLFFGIKGTFFCVFLENDKTVCAKLFFKVKENHLFITIYNLHYKAVNSAFKATKMNLSLVFILYKSRFICQIITNLPTKCFQSCKEFIF